MADAAPRGTNQLTSLIAESDSVLEPLLRWRLHTQQRDWIAYRPAPRALSPQASKRYRWLRWHAPQGENASLDRCHHGISRRIWYSKPKDYVVKVNASKHS